jgi:hypothetical protein
MKGQKLCTCHMYIYDYKFGISSQKAEESANKIWLVFVRLYLLMLPGCLHKLVHGGSVDVCSSSVRVAAHPSPGFPHTVRILNAFVSLLLPDTY